MEPRIITLIFYVFLSVTFFANAQTKPALYKNPNYITYIEQYYRIAEKQQKEYGIPASIILAQGLLESGAGQGKLARMSNNHFGIKCNDWKGEKVYHDDDEKGECFRKYKHVIESYEDHSLFLKNRPRYASLFSLKPTDYEGWAHGLKKAGYATDPSYAFKLISLIEDYELHRFDLGKQQGQLASNAAGIPASGPIGAVADVVNHEVVKVNKVRSIISVQGDTYRNIADEFNMTEERLRLYNEVAPDKMLKPGTRVYVSMKRKVAPRGNDYYTVKAGDSMHSIAQQFGMRTESIYKLNDLAYTETARVGQVLKLR